MKSPSCPISRTRLLLVVSLAVIGITAGFVMKADTLRPQFSSGPSKMNCEGNMAALYDTACFIEGTRDACMLFTVTDRLISNFQMTPSQALGFVRDMWEKKLICWMDLPNSGKPDWENDRAMIQLTKEGYEIIGLKAVSGNRTHT